MEDWQILVNLGSALGVRVRLREAAAQVRAAIAARFARRPGLERLAVAGVRPAGCGATLAAGVEPVGALEVGFHVSGSAAGERHGRSDRRCRCRRA